MTVDWNRSGSSLGRHKAAAGLAEAGVTVLYQDEHVIAADKPPGLLTDSASIEQARTRDTLRRRLGAFVREEGDRLHIVHRIDRDTSGVVLAARTERAAERLREQFFRGSPERRYLALVEGVPPAPRGTWVDWMAWDSAQHLQRPAGPDWEGAVAARAEYELVGGAGGVSLLAVRIHTGRRNQIRLHCQLRGHPILGESLYRDGRSRGPAAPRLALHAWRLGVTHPARPGPLQIEAPLAADLAELAGSLGLGAALGRLPDLFRGDRGGS